MRANPWSLLDSKRRYNKVGLVSVAVRTYAEHVTNKRQYGNVSDMVKTKKNRIGACMNAVSSGRSDVAGWYI